MHLNLKIHKTKDGAYQIQDENRQIYGTYSTEQEAQDRLEDWRYYYERPLFQ